MMLSRRIFLLGSASGVVALSWLGWRHTMQAECFSDFLRRHFHGCDINAIAQHLPSVIETPMTHLFSNGFRPAKPFPFLRQCIHDDYLANRTLQVDGWIISHTEAAIIRFLAA